MKDQSQINSTVSNSVSTKQATESKQLIAGGKKRKRKARESADYGYLDQSIQSNSKMVPAPDKEINPSPQQLGQVPDRELLSGPMFIRQKSKVIIESIQQAAPHVTSFWGGVYNRVRSFVRRQDIYGHPVTLNYQGEDTYKTCPGGCLSIFLFFALLCYFVLKFKFMIFKEEWQLIQQTVVAELDDLAVAHKFGASENSNISLALQFHKKKEKQTLEKFQVALDSRNDYNYYSGSGGVYYGSSGFRRLQGEDTAAIKEKQLMTSNIQRASRYLQLVALYEAKRGSRFSVFDRRINVDLFSWKQYQMPDLYENEHEMMELKLVLDEAIIKGTENHLQSMEKVISRFQIRYDFDRMKIDALEECSKKEDSVCKAILSDQVPQMLNLVYEATFNNYDRMTPEQRATATKAYTHMSDLAKDPSDKEKMQEFYEYYFSKYVTFKTKQLSNEASSIASRIIGQYGSSLSGSEASEYWSNTYPQEDCIRKYRNGMTRVVGSDVSRVLSMYSELNELQDKIKTYNSVQEDFEKEINEILKLYDIELVIYDEVEFFRDNNDDQFNYPYQRRKNMINKFAFASWNISDDSDYEYNLEVLKFQTSLACLEPSVFEQMDFISRLVKDAFSLINNLLTREQPIDQVNSSESSPKIGQDKCDNEGFLKLKYVSTQSKEKKYLDDYEKGVISNKILLEVQLEMDAFKTESLRTSTQILDFLGDLGGFYQSLDMIVFLFAEYFSARFFLASIATNLYLLKDSKKSMLFQNIKKGFLSLFQFKPKSPFEEESSVTDEEQEFKETVSEIKKNYKQIYIRPVHLIFDPIWRCLLDKFKICFKNSNSQRREKVLNQCHDKFTEELEITNILTRIRDCHEMLKFLKTSQQHQLLKFNEDRVIQRADDGESREDSSSDDNFNCFERSKTVLPEIQTELKYDDCVATSVSNALNFSVVQGTSVTRQKKDQLLEMMVQREGVMKATKGFLVKPNSLGISSGSPLNQSLNLKSADIMGRNLPKQNEEPDFDPKPMKKIKATSEKRKKVSQPKGVNELELTSINRSDQQAEVPTARSKRRSKSKKDRPKLVVEEELKTDIGIVVEEASPVKDMQTMKTSDVPSYMTGTHSNIAPLEIQQASPGYLQQKKTDPQRHLNLFDMGPQTYDDLVDEHPTDSKAGDNLESVNTENLVLVASKKKKRKSRSKSRRDPSTEPRKKKSASSSPEGRLGEQGDNE